MVRGGTIVAALTLVLGIVRAATAGEPTGDVPVSTGPGERAFLLGFQDFGWDKTPEGLEAMFAFHRKHSDIVCLQFGEICPWKEALNDEPFPEDVMERIRQRKEGIGDLKVYLELSPLNMRRSDMGGTIPYSFFNVPFNDSNVMEAFTKYTLRMCDIFDPICLCLGIEANNLADSNPPLWREFKELYKHVYTEVKKKRPELPVFVTVTLHNLLGKEAASNDKAIDEVKEILQYCDVIGISFYSFFGLRDPDNPTKNLDWLKEFAGNKPIAITETAYPAEPAVFPSGPAETTPQDQLDYFKTLFEVAQRDEYLFVIFFTYRDYDVWWEKTKDHWTDWVKVWKDTGVLDGNGNPRPSYHLWHEWLAKKYTGPFSR